MKKIILLSTFVLFTVFGFGQVRKAVLSVPDSTTNFGTTLPVNSLVFDEGANRLWNVTQSALATNNISTVTKKLITVPADGNGIYTGNGTTPTTTVVSVTDNLKFGTDRLYINETGGFVGIGTASPSTRLTVVGGQTSLNGSGATSGTKALSVSNSSTEKFFVRDDGMTSAADGYSINGTLWGHQKSSPTNNYIGNNIGLATSGGIWNAAMGNSSFLALSSGSYNNSFGGDNLKAITTTTGNNAFGTTVFPLATGNRNVGMGNDSWTSLVGGDNNTGVGSNTGINVTSGSRNLFLGYSTGASTSGAYTNSVAIGAYSAVTTSNQVVIGEQGGGAELDDLFFGRGVGQNAITALNTLEFSATRINAGVTDISSDYHWNFNASSGTGTGTGGDIRFKTAPAGTTGSTQNTLVEAITIKGAGNIGVGTTTPNASAKFDVVSTTQGVAIPRLTPGQRDAIVTPLTGLQIYNTTDNEVNFYNGSAWVSSGVVGDNSSVDAQGNVNQPIPNSFFTPVLLDAENYDTDGFHKTTNETSGTATAGTASTLTDGGAAWTVNQFQDMVVRITGGTGVNQVRRIISNTATVLTVANAWTTTPDATSTYEVTISNRITIPAGKGGKYLISPKLTFSGNATGIRGIAIYKGTTFINSVFGNPVGVVETIVPYASFVMDLVPGDWIEMRGYQTSGGVLNTLGSSSYKVYLQLTRQ